VSATEQERQAVIRGATQEIAQLEHLIQACREMQDELRRSLVLMDEGYTMTTILSREGPRASSPA
jgi:hypothetical protein